MSAKRAIPDLPGYDILERLGRGAHAVITRGVERATGRPVAIKHLIRRSAEDDKFITQAETEYEISRGFESPYLRKCYQIVRIRKWLKTRELFLVMEYIEGDTIENRHPDRIDLLTTIFIQVAEGLHALHKLGYAHADIKPNNILLCRGGGLKIIDFGQSCPLGHRKQRIQGTPDYMAPEQAHRQPIDQRTDVFNLGATMYWAVTGKAFKTVVSTAQTGEKLLAVESRRANTPPRELNPNVPAPLSQLIIDCCETYPTDRPRDMREVVSRLETVLHLLEQKRKSAAQAGR